jgi:adenylate cyclase class 2
MINQEFETQVLDIDKDKIAKKLRKLGAKETPEVMQRRIVYDILCLGAKGKSEGEWVRLRQVGDKKPTITYKNKTGSGISQTKEIEIEVDDFDRAAALLEKLKWSGLYYQENKRWKFELDEIEFTIDTWPMIPPILEIEAKGEEGVKKGLELLGLEDKDAGHIGTIAIYKKYGIDLHSYKELRFV